MDCSKVALVLTLKTCVILNAFHTVREVEFEMISFYLIF